MQFLLDTHTLIWYMNGDSQLSPNALAIVKDQQIDCYVSKASLWKIAIKINLGKLQISCPFPDLLHFISANNFQLLLLAFDHFISISTLPVFHRDPFDRMLIAQALTENLTVITKYPNFEQYGVQTLW